MKEKGTRWGREETIVVLDLYFRIPFTKSRTSHPEVQKVAEAIGRSPASVNLKIGNFGSLDPTLEKKGIVGLSHTSNLDKEIWKEFQGNYQELAFKSEALKNPRAKLYKLGGEGLTNTKYRIGQTFFRESILASYSSCCITGIANKQLLIASHIKPWTQCRDKEKANPQNGLCLNALHDKAFDRGLLTVDTDYKVRISKILSKSFNKAIKDFFIKYEGNKIKVPERLPPNKDFLAWHGKNIFISD